MNIYKTIINGFEVVPEGVICHYTIWKDGNPVSRKDLVKGDQKFLRSWIAHLVSPVVDNFVLFVAIMHKDLPSLIKLINEQLSGATQHVLLTYQLEIAQGAQRTYLEIPKTFKYGPFSTPVIPGNWQMIQNEQGIFWTNGMNYHPIWRSPEFAKLDYVTPKGIQNVT